MISRVLTAAIVVYSYFEITRGLPLLTAQIPTHHGRTIPVTQLVGTDLWVNLGLQIFLCALLLAVPYLSQVFPGAVHFGWRCLSEYTPVELRRVMPILKQMAGVMALMTAVCFGLRNHLWLQSASSQGPVLPDKWLDHEVWTQVEFIVALLIGIGVASFYYFARMDEAAGKSDSDEQASFD